MVHQINSIFPQSRPSVAIVPNNKGGSISTRSTRQSQAAHVLLANQNNLAFSQNGPQTGKTILKIVSTFARILCL